MAEWVRALACTGDRTVRDGFESHCVYPALPVSLGGDTKSRRSLLSGVYARGSKRFQQSALECVTVVDSTTHSKKNSPTSRVWLCGGKRCPALVSEEEATLLNQIVNLNLELTLALMHRKEQKNVTKAYQMSQVAEHDSASAFWSELSWKYQISFFCIKVHFNYTVFCPGLKKGSWEGAAWRWEGVTWRNETRAWRRALPKTPRPNTAICCLAAHTCCAWLRTLKSYICSQVRQ